MFSVKTSFYIHHFFWITHSFTQFLHDSQLNAIKNSDSPMYLIIEWCWYKNASISYALRIL